MKGDRLYRTGDIGFFCEITGQLVLLGRRDSQVKINGVRCELGELEACASRCTGVERAVVIMKSGRLVLYYTGQCLLYMYFSLSLYTDIYTNSVRSLRRKEA